MIKSLLLYKKTSMYFCAGSTKETESGKFRGVLSSGMKVTGEF